MEKLSSADIASLLERTRGTIAHLSEENSRLTKEAQNREQRDRASALLDKLEARNLSDRISGATRQEKIASLADRDLRVMEQAMELQPEAAGSWDAVPTPSLSSRSSADARLLQELHNI